MHHLPRPILPPLTKVVVDDSPWGQIMWQHPPGTPSAQQIEDPVQDFPLGVDLGSAPRFRVWHEMLEQGPFFITEIRGVRLSRVHASYGTRAYPAIVNFLDTL
jgi:hypothetical protein